MILKSDNGFNKMKFSFVLNARIPAKKDVS